MIVLGIETSCDETSVAIVRDGKEVLSNVVSSQIDIHKKYGGVVPEIASRYHIEAITIVLEEAINLAKIEIKDIDLIAVTKGPGLIGALLTGIGAALAFAYGNNIPIIGVNHMSGHIYANYLENDFIFPLIALVVSGGHTELVLMEDHQKYQVLGKTLDDAVGEAYDKVGRVMGLAYPAGPLIDKLSKNGYDKYHFPRSYLDKEKYAFSFSGLKSAVINLVNHKKMQNEEIDIENIARSFQESVVDVLVYKTKKAIDTYQVKSLLLAGGVAANEGLRNRIKEVIKDIPVMMPKLKYCTDNAAMIASSGYFTFLANNQVSDDLIDAIPSLELS